MSFSINKVQLLYKNKEVGYLYSKVYNNGMNLGRIYFSESKCKYYSLVEYSKDFFDNLMREDFVDDIYISFYSPDTNQSTICDVWKKDGKVFIVTDRVIYLSDWDEYFSLKKFMNEFPEYVKNSSSFGFSYGEYDFTVSTLLEVNPKEKLFDKYTECKTLYKTKFKEFINLNNIESSISFSPEHLIAGSSILQYFGKLLQEKYPNEKVSVSIKQEDLKVTMIVETPEGKKEEIEEYLNRYGMVVMNQLPPEEFASNPIQLVELKQELRDAQNKIAFQQELLALKDDSYKNRILSLEDEVKFLREEFSAIRKSNDESIKTLLSSLLTKDKLIEKLTNAIDNKNKEESKQLITELKEKDSKGYTSLKEHIDNVVVGNLQNTPSWIDFLSKVI